MGVEASRAAGWLARLPLDMAAGGVGLLAGQLGRIRPSREVDGDDAPPVEGDLTVMLVHGLGDGDSIVAPLRRGLDGLGAGPFVTVNYQAFGPDIRVAARVLGEQVELASAGSPGRSVVVIAYSLGGLVARYYVQALGGDARVPLVVTLATPHGGTAAALLAPPHPLLRQLRPGSSLLTELAGPAADCRTRFVAFYSDLDEVVIPASRGRIDHPDLKARNVLVPGVGHLTLPLHQPVIDQVRSLLTAARQTDRFRRGPGERQRPRKKRGAPSRPRCTDDSRTETGDAES